MQFCDLKAQYSRLREEINVNIQRVLDHGVYIMGPEIAELEKEIASYLGVKHVITVSNGTDALLMPLMAWGIGKGDAVFVPSFTFAATAEVVGLVGATPVFVDIDPLTFNISTESLEARIKDVLLEGKLKPKVIIPVDLFGLAADYDAIKSIAEKYGLLVLEDAAQGFGCVYKGRKGGSLGHVSATSFFPSKPLGCYGDGGAIMTDDDVQAELLRSIRVHGKGIDKYDNVRLGLNARLDTLQAAILLPKLSVFEDELRLRNKVAAAYTEQLSGSQLVTPYVPKDSVSAWAQYSVLAKNTSCRHELMTKLKAKGIPTMIYYPKPLHIQQGYMYISVLGDNPVTDDICSRIFSLPMHPYLSSADIKAIASAIKE